MCADRTPNRTPLRRPAALAALLLVAACAQDPDRAPRPRMIQPGGGARGVPTPVTILGDGFLPRVVQSSSGGPATIDTTHRAFLGGQELADVTWVNAGTLRATVPAGLPLGANDLVVENALGLRGSLPAAWEAYGPPRAALSALLAIPSTIPVGSTFQATLTVTDVGGATATGVSPGPLEPAPDATGAVTILSGPAPAAQDVGAGASGTFTWTLQLTTAGDVRLRAGAAGTDGNDGLPVVAAPVESNLGTQLTEATPIATNPLGDGTKVASIAVAGGFVYLGPSTDGSKYLRLDPATGATVLTGISIAVDTGSTQATNTWWQSHPPATTFGTAGCSTGSGRNPTPAGRTRRRAPVQLAAGHFHAADRLVHAGASFAGPRATCTSRSSIRLRPSTLSFASVDLGGPLPHRHRVIPRSRSRRRRARIASTSRSPTTRRASLPTSTRSRTCRTPGSSTPPPPRTCGSSGP